MIAQVLRQLLDDLRWKLPDRTKVSLEAGACPGGSLVLPTAWRAEDRFRGLWKASGLVQAMRALGGTPSLGYRTSRLGGQLVMGSVFLHPVVELISSSLGQLLESSRGPEVIAS